MSLNQRVTAEFSTCTPCAPHARDLSIQTSNLLICPQRVPWRWSARGDAQFSHERRVEGKIDNQFSWMQKYQVDIQPKPTTIGLWISWIRPSQLCLIRRAGR